MMYIYDATTNEYLGRFASLFKVIQVFGDRDIRWEEA